LKKLTIALAESINHAKLVVITALLSMFFSVSCLSFPTDYLNFDAPRDFSGTWGQTCFTTKGLLIQDPDYQCDPRIDTFNLNLIQATSPTDGKFTMTYEGKFVDYRDHYLETASSEEIARFCPNGANHYNGFGWFCQFNKLTWAQEYTIQMEVGWRIDGNGKWGIYDSANQTTTISIIGTRSRDNVPCGALHSPEASGYLLSDRVDNWNYPLTEVSSGSGLIATIGGGSGQTDTDCGLTITDKFGSVVRARVQGGIANHYDLSNARSFSPAVIGKFFGHLVTSQPVVTPTDDKVTLATLRLYRQSSYIRSQRENESAEDYEIYIDAQKKTLVKQCQCDLKGKTGHFSFDDLPAFDFDNVNGQKIYRPVYYTLEVAAAETQEIFLDTVIDGDVSTADTTTLYYANRRISNLSLSTTEPAIEHSISLDPFDGLGTKRALAIQLSGPKTKTLYKPIEDQVIAYLDSVANGDTEKTAELLEGLNRAIWAERLVRDGAIYSEKVLELMLAGLGNLLADFFDKFIDKMREAPALQQRQLKRAEATEARLSDAYKAGFKLDRDSLNLWNEATRLLSPHKNAEMAKIINETIKSLSAPLEIGLIKAGVSASDAEEITSTFVKVTNPIVRGLAGAFISGKKGAAAGAAQGIGKQMVEFLVGETLPLFLDSTTFPSYTKKTAPYLIASVDNFKAWDSSDPLQYKADRNAVIETMTALGSDTTKLMQRVQIQLGFAQGLDVSQDAAALIGRAVKWVQVAEKVIEAMKHLSNGISFVEPMSTVYGTIPDYVKKGTREAYGITTSSKAFSRKASARDISKNKATYNPALMTEVETATEELLVVIENIETALAGNDLGSAIKLLSNSDNTDLDSHIQSWKQSVSRFLLQVRGAEQDILPLLVTNITLEAVYLDLLERIHDLYYGVFTGRFAGVDDPVYLTARNKITSIGLDASTQFNAFIQTLSSLSTTLSDQDLIPAVVVESVSLQSTSTGKSIITKTNEIFSVKVRVKNISDMTLQNLTGVLTVTSRLDSINIQSSAEISVATLEANDNVNASRMDEVELTWEFEYTGALTGERIFLSVHLLEDDQEPASFISTDTQFILAVDSLLSDSDSDLMPDDWEADNQLDITKDDSVLDADGDGLSNKQEFELGTNPQIADSDNDGLSDFEEINGGVDGFVTDPLNSDSDNDGTQDGEDLQPNNSESIEAGETPEEPVIVVDPLTVTLSKEKPVATVSVSNSGTGRLGWLAVSQNTDAVVTHENTQPFVRDGNGLALLSITAHYDFSTAYEHQVQVKFIDALGATKDTQNVTVTLLANPDATEICSTGEDLGDVTDVPGDSDPGDTDTTGSGNTDTDTTNQSDDTTNETSTKSAGGCSLGPNRNIDITLLLLVLISIFWLCKSKRLFRRFDQ